MQARKIIKEYQPNAVLGMGGYVSGPGGIAAKLCGVPVILHEQNAVAGLTNEWLAKIATRVLQAFQRIQDAEVVETQFAKIYLKCHHHKRVFRKKWKT